MICWPKARTSSCAGGEVDGVGGVADDDEALLPLPGELRQLAFSENAGFAAARIAREHLHGIGADGARITRCAVEAFSCGHMGAEMEHRPSLLMDARWRFILVKRLRLCYNGFRKSAALSVDGSPHSFG